MSKNILQDTIREIESELGRLDAEDSKRNCSGIAVYADGDLPLGWVRLSDGTASVYGKAEEILAVLREVEYDQEAKLRNQGWELAWESLEFPDHAPDTTSEWPEDLWKLEQLEEGTPNDEPLTLIRVETNAGARWASGPHGVFTCALSEAIQHDSLYETREAAIEGAGEYDAGEYDAGEE